MVNIEAAQINHSGLVAGAQVSLAALGDMNILGGSVVGRELVQLKAGGGDRQREFGQSGGGPLPLVQTMTGKVSPSIMAMVEATRDYKYLGDKGSETIQGIRDNITDFLAYNAKLYDDGLIDDETYYQNQGWLDYASNNLRIVEFNDRGLGSFRERMEVVAGLAQRQDTIVADGAKFVSESLGIREDFAAIVAAAALKRKKGVGNSGYSKGTTVLSKTETVKAKEGLLQAEPTGHALKGDVTHRSAPFYRGEAAKSGTHYKLNSDDGTTSILTQVPGSLNGKPGRYEYIVNGSGKLTHQRFVEGGTINGIPNSR